MSDRKGNIEEQGVTWRDLASWWRRNSAELAQVPSPKLQASHSPVVSVACKWALLGVYREDVQGATVAECSHDFKACTTAENTGISG